MGKIEGKPPFDLVQLSTLPESMWKGRAVFTPSMQQGTTPYWQNKDLPEIFVDPGDTEPWTSYDTGVVLEWWVDETVGDTRVRFVGDSGSTLVYGAWNLWTPRPEDTQTKIVAWLRSVGHFAATDGQRVYLGAAMEIERGAHLEKVPDVD